MDKHHRLPRSRGGGNHGNNISIVERNQHRAWHLLVGNMTAPEVARMLSDVWIDSNYYLIAVPRKRPPHNKRRTRAFCTDCEAEVLTLLPTVTKRGKK